ncbi:RNA methyltransferase [Candidatus Sumerlaeota bacterium]|nr:RNA methyltransferase [Candidatus Sumerlaeota bacterium]
MREHREVTELWLRNPHSVLATLTNRPNDVLWIALPQGKAGDAWSDVETLARQHRVPLRTEKPPQDHRINATQPSRKFTRKGNVAQPPSAVRHSANAPSGRRTHHDSGRAEAHGAMIRPREACDVSELFADAKDGDLWLALDCVQDPHNIGAVFRAAGFFGVRGILLSDARSAPLSAVAYDVASGGLEAVPYSRPANLANALRAAKDAGIWLLGAAEEADQSYREIPRDRPWLLILGNEETGLRRLTREHCDQFCSISSAGPVGSLNVSVAAGILIAALTGR